MRAHTARRTLHRSGSSGYSALQTVDVDSDEEEGEDGGGGEEAGRGRAAAAAERDEARRRMMENLASGKSVFA